MKYLMVLGIIFLLVTPQLLFSNQGIWGRLTNPEFENHPIKSTFFFAGNVRDGNQYYDVNASSNYGLFTIHPTNSQHLHWSVESTNRTFAVDALVNTGVNVINMSYWGMPRTDNWAWWAPMQSSTGSHDELFDAVIDKPILISPYIESFAETPNSPGFAFRDDFLSSTTNPAPHFIMLCEDLIERYLINPQNNQWPNQWAKVFDRFGQERYLISVIHVSSNQNNMNDETFARGFDDVARKILADTGIFVGFAIDVMPPGTFAPGNFRASPQTTGNWLAEQHSILAIQCFISEIWVGTNNETQLIDWKKNFALEWIQTGIPLIFDISPGYDAHIVFPNSALYGNNSKWRHDLSNLVFQLPVQGVTFNSWNGYTEGMAGVPTTEFAADNSEWMKNVFQNFAVGQHFLVPDKIEAESFSQMLGVKTEKTIDTGGGLDVCWIEDGDWMEYDIVAFKSGIYLAEFRTAKLSNAFQGLMFISVDGQMLSRVFVPGTGNWQDWTTIFCHLNLKSGVHKLRLYADTGGWNLNWLNLSLVDELSVHNIPGHIEAEAFANMAGVEIEILTSDITSLGWFDNNDWIDYNVFVQEAGKYTMNLRIAQADDQPSGIGELQKNEKRLCTFEIPSTGEWNEWSAITTTVNLDAGEQTLRLYVKQAPWNLDCMEFIKTNTHVR